MKHTHTSTMCICSNDDKSRILILCEHTELVLTLEQARQLIERLESEILLCKEFHHQHLNERSQKVYHPKQGKH